MKWNKAEGEGENVYLKCVALSDELKKIRHFMMPNGTVIQLPDILSASGFVTRNDGISNAPIGTLASVTDGKYDYKLMNSQLFVFGYNDGISFVPKYDLSPKPNGNKKLSLRKMLFIMHLKPTYLIPHQ